MSVNWHSAFTFQSNTKLFVKNPLDRACICQDSRDGQIFCEISATQLRQLQDVYSNSTSVTSSDDSDGNEKCYIMPKLQKLLTVLKENKNSQSEGKKIQSFKKYLLFLKELDNKPEFSMRE